MIGKSELSCQGGEDTTTRQTRDVTSKVTRPITINRVNRRIFIFAHHDLAVG